MKQRRTFKTRARHWSEGRKEQYPEVTSWFLRLRDSYHRIIQDHDVKRDLFHCNALQGLQFNKLRHEVQSRKFQLFRNHFITFEFSWAMWFCAQVGLDRNLYQFCFDSYLSFFTFVPFLFYVYLIMLVVIFFHFYSFYFIFFLIFLFLCFSFLLFSANFCKINHWKKDTKNDHDM